MAELFALVLYSAQWFGIVLGVGAEVVLLLAHLFSLHEHEHEWLKLVPSVRAAQGIGLVFIVVSGAGAVGSGARRCRCAGEDRAAAAPGS